MYPIISLLFQLLTISLFDSNVYAVRTFTVQSCHATGRHKAHSSYPLFRWLHFFLSLRCVNYFSYELQINWKIFIYFFIPSLHLQRIELSAAIFISLLRAASFFVRQIVRGEQKKKNSEFEIIDAAAESAICKSFICFVWPNGIACWLLCGLFDTYARFSLSCDVRTAATVERTKSEWNRMKGPQFDIGHK